MKFPSIGDLPKPPIGKTGWPWTEETKHAQVLESDEILWPKVSIVTPSFNQGTYIEETIRSVLLQRYPDLEYIIIDGGSTDDTVKVLKKYEQWITFWVSEPDQGTSHAINKGYKYAKGKLYGIMCADDYFMPDGIKSLVKLQLLNPQSVAFIGRCPEINLSGQVVNSGMPFIRVENEIGDWGVGGWFVSVACLFSADLFKRVGGLDERLRTGNDIDLWIKLKKHGSFELTDVVVATARLNPDSLSHQDYCGELTAWIAANYINGHRDVAKKILLRYGDNRVHHALANLSPNEKVLSINWQALLKAIAHRVKKGIVRRMQNNTISGK